MRFDSPLRLLTILLILPALVWSGCGKEGPSPGSVEVPQGEPASAPAGPPTLMELASATFYGVGEEMVTLTQGRWEGEPFVEGGAARPSVGLAEDFLLTGDLNGDGSDESVALLWSSSGGSGTFDYVAVVGRESGEVVNLGTAELGDRVKVQAGRVKEGRIELDVVQAGPEDAMCCPTQMATRTWSLGADGLAEGEAEITGTLSLATLEGPEWVLDRLAWEEPAPAEPRVTLGLEQGRFAGSAGCNNYFSDVTEESDTPGQISVGPVGTTRMMCPEEVMAVEGRYLKQLGAVSGYGFLAGKLALSWQSGDQGGLMLFTPGQP